jgi:hypothetical protein
VVSAKFLVAIESRFRRGVAYLQQGAAQKAQEAAQSNRAVSKHNYESAIHLG